MPKTDKEILYTEVFGTKVRLPQYYNENGDPVAISTETPVPVKMIDSGADGKAAYDITVEHGFEGTEEE